MSNSVLTTQQQLAHGIGLALAQLRSDNDEHWTSDGLPRTDVVSKILGSKVARKVITESAPNFTRSGKAEIEAAAEKAGAAIEAKIAEKDASPQSASADAAPAAPAKEADEDEDDEDDEAISALEQEYEDEDILALPINEILATEAMVRRGIEAINRQSQVIHAHRAEVDEALKQLGAKGEYLTRALVRFERMNKGNASNVTQAYLKSEREKRRKDAERTVRLLGGIDPSVLRTIGRSRSPIDAALNARGRGRGTKRPSVPGQGGK